MTKTSCYHPNLLTELISYQIKKNLDDFLADRAGFEIYHIEETNVFLIIRPTSMDTEPDSCVCSDWTARKPPWCLPTPATQCECPCYKYSHTLICNQTTSDDSKLCSPYISQSHQHEQLTSREVALREVSMPCYLLDCAKNHNVMHCHQVSGCRWCSVSEKGRDLGSNSFCAEENVCHFGMVGHYGLLHDVTVVQPSRIWYYVTAITIFIIGLLGLLYLGYRLKCLSRKRNEAGDKLHVLFGLSSPHSSARSTSNGLHTAQHSGLPDGAGVNLRCGSPHTSHRGSPYRSPHGSPHASPYGSLRNGSYRSSPRDSLNISQQAPPHVSLASDSQTISNHESSQGLPGRSIRKEHRFGMKEKKKKKKATKDKDKSKKGKKSKDKDSKGQSDSITSKKH